MFVKLSSMPSALVSLCAALALAVGWSNLGNAQPNRAADDTDQESTQLYASADLAPYSIRPETDPAPFGAACGGAGNKRYEFSGTLEVEYDRDGDGTLEAIPLEGVQLRIVRAGSPLKWAQGPDAVTDANGRYSVTCTFARDRNGVAPGGKKIRFKVMARFRDSEFKIRKAGWAQNNWFEVGRERGCNRSGGVFTDSCKDFRFDSVDRTFDTDNTAGKHAYMWWFYNHLQDELEQQNVGLTDRPFFSRKLVITYPERNLFKSGSSFLFNVHLEEGDWDDTRTMIHEYMHRWDVGKLGGEGHVSCLGDAHHESPDNWRSSRCSGFMEGFAEAAAAGLEQALFGGGISLRTHADLRTGNLGYADASNNFSVETRSEAERTDVGWENFIKLILVDNEMDVVSGSASCDPTDVGIFDMLRVLQADQSRKANWYQVRPNASFSWFTGVLETHVSNFTSDDAEMYQKLGDPALSAGDVCGSTTTRTSPLAEAAGDVAEQQEQNFDPDRARNRADRVGEQPQFPGNLGDKLTADFSGVWDTSFGELRLHQVEGYVIGDYADSGIIAGEVSGSCVAGVFTNGERNGIFRFNASDTDRFEGEWAWHGQEPSGDWSGTRTFDEVAQLQNFTHDGSATQITDNDRTAYDGTYRSDYGPVELFSRDLVLVGDYADRGIIAGVWDGNSFVGRFTNGDRTGWFDLAFFSRNGSFRNGEWGWVGDSSSSWNLTEENGSTPEITNLVDDVSCK